MQGQGTQQRPASYIAGISHTGHAGFAALWDAEQRDIPLFAPSGITWRPADGDQLLMLSGEGRDVCAGVLCKPSAIASGELLLSNAGGGRILLRQNGDVIINGVTITKDGEIIPKGE